MKKNIIYFLPLIFLSTSLFAVEYKIVVRAHHGIAVAFKQWQPTLDIISKQIPEHTFNLLPVVSLNEITQLAGKNKFDFVLTNPSSYVELEQLYAARALATLNNKRADTAQARFGSVIFTHASNVDIVRLNDLQDKTLMAVSEPAFGGWRVAWLEMLDNGFDPYRELKALKFAESKTQPEVVWAVRDSLVDAGVVRTDLLERLETSGKIDMRYFRVINNQEHKGFPFFISTKLYPEWAFAAMKSVPAELSQQVSKILLAIPAKSAAAKAGKYVGWLPPKDYNRVRKLMKKLKIGSYAK